MVLRRYAQFAVDRLLVTVPAVVLAVAFLLLTRHHADRRVVAYGTFGICLVAVLAGNWLVEVWVPYRRFQGTPGMRWLGLKVVALDGGRPGFRAFTIRWLMVVVDGYFFGAVGALVIACTRRHQRVGDLVAGTLVVRR